MGRKVSERTGKPPEVQFLFQRISVLVKASIQSFFTRLFQLRTTPTFAIAACFTLYFKPPESLLPEGIKYNINNILHSKNQTKYRAGAILV